MPPIGIIKLAVRRAVQSRQGTRGQIKPIGWVALGGFVILTFVFYFIMISQL